MTTTSLASKLVPTSSLKVKVNVTALPAAAEVIATVGGVVSVDEPPPQAVINKVAANAQAVRMKVVEIWVMAVSLLAE